ncbi:MAG: hypothetical protein OQL11_13370 [Gammaproteobacteria bacterium]|nr:hypothetical protein [Gammaproteobacteria bacterium]
MQTRRRLCTALAGICLFLVVPVLPAHASDPYLDMLEEEAQVLELIKTAEQMDAKAQSSTGGISDENTTRAMLGPGMSTEQFDAALKAHFVGTYMLYDKLSAEQKAAVYARYQRDGRIMEIRRAIAKHL